MTADPVRDAITECRKKIEKATGLQSHSCDTSWRLDDAGSKLLSISIVMREPPVTEPITVEAE